MDEVLKFLKKLYLVLTKWILIPLREVIEVLKLGCLLLGRYHRPKKKRDTQFAHTPQIVKIELKTNPIGKKPSHVPMLFGRIARA